MKLGAILIILLFFSGTSTLYAQGVEIAEIKDNLHLIKSNRKKAVSLQKVAELYSPAQPDSTCLYAQKALELFLQEEIQRGIVESGLLLAKSANQIKSYELALYASENVLKHADDSKHSDQLASAYLEEGIAQYYLRSPDSAIVCLQKSIDFNGTKENLDGANAHRILALCHWSKGEYADGLVHANHAVSTLELLADRFFLSKALNTRGAIYWGMGYYDYALENYLKALLLEEHREDPKQRIILMGNIGLVYYDLGNFKRAYEYYQQAMNLISLTKDELAISYTLLNLGSYHLSNNEIPLALDFLDKAEKGYDQINDINGVALCLIRKGQCHNKAEDYSRAISVLKKALALAAQTGNKDRETSAYYHMANAFNATERMDSAIHYLTTGYYLSKEFNLNAHTHLFCSELGKLNEEQGNYEDALAYVKEANEIGKTIYENKLEVQSRIMELTRENELRKVENEKLIALNKENEQTILYIGILVLLVVVFTVVTLVYSSYLRKQRRELLNAIRTKDTIFSIVAHDIRGPVGNLKNMIDLMVSEDFEDDYHTVLKMFKPTVTTTFNMLNNLLIWAKSNLGKLEVENEIVKLTELLKGTISELNYQARQKSIAIELEIHKEVIMSTDMMIVGTVLRNLISNAIKFTPKEGKVRVSYSQTNDHLTVTVKDTGVGIASDMQEQLKNGSTAFTKGTNNEKGSGLGLLLSRELLTKINGKLEFESVPGQGSSFFVTIPT